MNDSTGPPLELVKSDWLTVRFTIFLFRVKFLVSDRLSVEVIIGTALLNNHVTSTLCTSQRIQIRNGELPMLKKFDGFVDGELTSMELQKWTDGPTKTLQEI